jgi:acetyltransferase-like isoleucine patch superfamily enzyme
MRNFARVALHRLIWWHVGCVRAYRRWRFRVEIRLLCIRDHGQIRVVVDPTVVFDGAVRIRIRHSHATGSVRIDSGAVIGDDVEIWLGNGDLHIGHDTLVRSGCVLMADGDLTVGADAVLSWNVYLLSTERVTIGDRVAFAQGCTVVDSRHVWGPGARAYTDTTETAPVTIHDEVFVATGSVVVAGADVGRRCLIGANAVVSGRHEPGGLLLGAPARWQPLPARLGGDAVLDSELPGPTTGAPYDDR